LGLKVFSERFFLKDSILKVSGFVEKCDSERFHSERFRAPSISRVHRFSQNCTSSGFAEQFLVLTGAPKKRFLAKDAVL
jgi:hypothetical protein